MLTTACSLFSGCGGDTLGMTSAGISVTHYSELKPLFCQSHDSNFPHSTCIGNDITKVPDSTLIPLKGSFDVVFAGFPCQSFSNGGKKDANDPRGQLFKEFVRVARCTQPKVVIGENVKGLLTRVNNDGEKFIDIIVEEFRKIGYKCIFKVYNTQTCNVSQSRERLIIVGYRNDIGIEPQLPTFEYPLKNLQSIVKFDMTGTISIDEEVLKDVPDECILTDLNNVQHATGGHPYLMRLVDQRNIRYKEGSLFKYALSFGKRDSPIHGEIIDIRKPSKTIICTYERQPRLFVPIRNAHGCYLRCLLPDELKQIQGFPPDYILCGKPKDQIVQIGNAVPPPLIESLLKFLITSSIA